MVEIVHPAVTVPQPALPILASALLDAHERKRQIFVAESGEKIKTGYADLDEHVLQGGFERGVVVGISQTDEYGSTDGQMVKYAPDYRLL